MKKMSFRTKFGEELCLEADLLFLDCVTAVTLSFKSACSTVFFSMFSLRCSP
ncbi:hypothetical protein [uncultured Prevotella sp.]|uniref:hypothetical protein n=1 Tax=uncultured Prevotella sp. TaxID=159272 RepID=UPI0025869AAD|nr:hypothetical protein [uncultured Prevotella sp.]